MTTRTIAILGTGLIGASLGLALGTADPEESPLGKVHLVGYDSDKHQLRTARGRLALDSEAASAHEAVKGADIVVLATPVQTLPDLMREISPHLKYGALVTDVCSTKQQVMQWARELLPGNINFVGGHPMAGRERPGADHAEIDLFQHTIYCLCADVDADPQAVDLASMLVEALGAKPYFIDPIEHDVYVGGVSHLPFILSIALAKTVGTSASWTEMQLLAATGFRDISRLAAGDPVMHHDICMTNQDSLVHWINEAIRTLVDIRSSIQDDQSDQLTSLFAQAKAIRDAWILAPANQRPGEGRPMRKDELAPQGLSTLIMGNPEELIKKLRKKK